MFNSIPCLYPLDDGSIPLTPVASMSVTPGLPNIHYAQSLSCVQLFVSLWTVACQAPPSMEFSRQEYWSGLQFSTLGKCPLVGHILFLHAFFGSNWVVWSITAIKETGECDPFLFFLMALCHQEWAQWYSQSQCSSGSVPSLLTSTWEHNDDNRQWLSKFCLHPPPGFYKTVLEYFWNSSGCISYL